MKLSASFSLVCLRLSGEMLSVIFGLNPGIIWSFCHRPERYYRTFTIKKGTGERFITAPRIGLKVIQKWMGYHLSKLQFPNHVYGFVPGESHIGAALVHVDAEWAVSVDIRDFFPSTPRAKIIQSLIELSYSPSSAEIIANLNTLNGVLVQGSPAIPALSNICFFDFDEGLRQISIDRNCRLSRFADDITFSGLGQYPEPLVHEVGLVLAAGPWRLNEQKTEVQPLKGRIKVHGLLIKESTVRLTKGYRNKIRAYAHLVKTKTLPLNELRMMAGHLNYANQVNAANGLPSEFNIDIPKVQAETAEPRRRQTFLSLFGRIFQFRPRAD